MTRNAFVQDETTSLGGFHLPTGKHCLERKEKYNYKVTELDKVTELKSGITRLEQIPYWEGTCQ